MRIQKADISLIALFVVLSASLTLNVVLGWKLHDRGASLARPGGIQVGTTLPTMPVVDVGGKAANVAFTGAQRTLLYVMSPSCIWCERNYANISKLAAAKGADFRFVGISNSDKRLDEVLTRKSLPFPVYVVKEQERIMTLGLEATPQLALIDAAGKVEKVWVGAWDAATQEEIEAMFATSLPGLLQEDLASARQGQSKAGQPGEGQPGGGQQ